MWRFLMGILERGLTISVTVTIRVERRSSQVAPPSWLMNNDR